MQRVDRNTTQRVQKRGLTSSPLRCCGALRTVRCTIRCFRTPAQRLKPTACISHVAARRCRFHATSRCGEPEDAKTQKRLERFWTALVGPAGIFARKAKTQKRREHLTDSFSWSHRDFCQEGKNTKTPGAFDGQL